MSSAADNAINPPQVGWTVWHITWGTYGARLHGGVRPTVDRLQNRPGEAFVAQDAERERRQRRALKGGPVNLTTEHRRFIERETPRLCRCGGWIYRICAAQHDHVHVLLDAPSSVHGRQVRELLKRWGSQALNEHSGKPPGGRWWAKGGSTKAVDHAAYLQNTVRNIDQQRRTLPD